MLSAVWLIPAFPLLGAIVLLAFGRKLGEPWAGIVATTMTAGAFVAGAVTFAGLVAEEEEHRSFVFRLFDWMPVGGFHVDVGFLVDPLSMTMVLFITGIGSLIHLYSIGYMHGDRGFPRFFLYLNLFVFSMLMLVLGDNLLLTFLGWEGVGACSYWLISFWFEETPNAVAGKKAFVTNRVGDFGFMLATFLTFATFGTINYAGDHGFLHVDGDVAAVTVTAILLLLFVGACGKSAQLPLYVWLPDAMAGPTPVSALIHAATMVTSGVYLMVRVSPIVPLSFDWTLDVIAWVGAATALFAATVAVSQRDIKKVLAYSTVSQLGYMFLAVGSGAYIAAIFHMVTHAFFKALLFLGAGSVIHGVGGEQDMRHMGGLRKWMPITCGTFIVGWLAIAGVPPFAGFWSKDEILLSAFDQHPVLWAVGLLTALLTAFYMSRQVFLVFFGEPRAQEGHASEAAHSAHEVAAHDASHEETSEGVAPTEGARPAELAEPGGKGSPSATGPAHGDGDHGGTPHESPWTMWVPLVVLALLAMAGGFMNLPFNDDVKFLGTWLEPVVHGAEIHPHVSSGVKVLLAVIATLAGLVGIGLAVAVYLLKRVKPVEPELLLNAYHYDDGIAAVVSGPLMTGAVLAADVVDKQGIDGAVNGAGWVARWVGSQVRKTQTGYVRNYALGIAAGAVLALAWFLVRAGW
jgi:NADH-quinone oxidoreductase subunit L